MLAVGGAHHDPAAVIVLRPSDLARVEVDLTLAMDQVLGDVQVRPMQREHFAGTHRRLANGDRRALKDEPVIVRAALARGSYRSSVIISKSGRSTRRFRLLAPRRVN
ncbi:MAG: hypothetical protein ACYDC2_05355 [Solirubrobacteraceae bacterium]